MRTFGIEIECIRPAHLSHGDIATTITAAGVTCRHEAYNHSTRSMWKIVTDMSLGTATGLEVVSPVLNHDLSGWSQVKTVMDAVKAAGCTVNIKCGLHVHVGVSDFDLDQLRKLAKLFLRYEDAFDFIVPKSRRADRNQYVLSNRSLFGGYTMRDAVRGMEAIDLANSRNKLIETASGRSRYRKLNLHALTRHGTVEFRQHSGTVESEKALHWVQLVVGLVERSKTYRFASWEAVDGHGPREELTRLLRVSQVPVGTKAYFRARAEHFAQQEAAPRPNTRAAVPDRAPAELSEAA